MNKLAPFGGVLAAVVVAVLIALAGSQGGVRLGDGPLFALCIGLAFVVQWLAFVPAYALQTEKFYDLVGGLTYMLVVALAWWFGQQDARAALLAALILIWAARLASFLFLRVMRDGHDARFQSIKPHLPVFLMTWTLQGLWVSVTASCALAAMTSKSSVEPGVFAVIGTLIWVVGFTFEVLADRQKSAFRAKPENREAFITTGLWAWCRHPNYFGEIVLWSGVAVIAWPVLEGWQYVTLISPVFVWMLLTRISGVRMLEARAARRWGEDEAYQRYRDTTPTLLPRPPR